MFLDIKLSNVEFIVKSPLFQYYSYHLQQYADY